MPTLRKTAAQAVFFVKKFYINAAGPVRKTSVKMEPEGVKSTASSSMRA